MWFYNGWIKILNDSVKLYFLDFVIYKGKLNVLRKYFVIKDIYLSFFVVVVFFC